MPKRKMEKCLVCGKLIALQGISNHMKAHAREDKEVKKAERAQKKLAATLKQIQTPRQFEVNELIANNPDAEQTERREEKITELLRDQIEEQAGELYKLREQNSALRLIAENLATAFADMLRTLTK